MIQKRGLGRRSFLGPANWEDAGQNGDPVVPGLSTVIPVNSRSRETWFCLVLILGGAGGLMYLPSLLVTVAFSLLSLSRLGYKEGT